MLTILAAIVISTPALATTPQFDLVKKLEGPDSWICSPQVSLKASEGRLEIIGSQSEPAISALLENVNKGPICSKLNSSYILGGVRCTENKMTSSGQNFLYETRDCTANGFWASRCSPDRESPSVSVQVQESGHLVVRKAIGWVNAPYFTCQYVLRR